MQYAFLHFKMNPYSTKFYKNRIINIKYPSKICGITNAKASICYPEIEIINTAPFMELFHRTRLISVMLLL